MPRAHPVCENPFNVHKKRVHKTVKPIGPGLLVTSRRHFPSHNWTAQTLLCVGCRMTFYDAKKLASRTETGFQLLEEPNEGDNLSGQGDDDRTPSPPADVSPHPSNSQREQRQQGKPVSSGDTHYNPFVVLDRDPGVESFIVSKPSVDENKVNKVCFGCGLSPLKDGPLRRPNLEQKTNLYKSIIIDQSFRAKMSPSMYKNFAHNDQSCGDCWRMIHEVWTLHQEIVATQKRLDGLVAKGRECVMKSKSRLKVTAIMNEMHDTSPTPKRDHYSPPGLLFSPKIDPDVVPKEEASDHGEYFDDDDFALIPEIDNSEDRFYGGDDGDENSEEKVIDQKNPSSVQLHPITTSENSQRSERRRSRKVQEEKMDQKEELEDLDSDSSDEDSTSDSDYELDLFNKREDRECTVCGREFKKFGSLIRHEVLVCKVAYDKKELDRINISFYPCKLCEKQFAASAELQRHIMSHTGEKRPSCPKCGKSHANVHYTNEMLCKKCDNKSEEDVKVKLPTPKTFQCSHCGKQLATHINLISHEIRICKLPYDEDALRRKGIRLRRCDHALCDEVFVTSRQFKRHVLTHTGGTIHSVRKHGCNQCGKLFIKAQYLSSHKKMWCPAGTVDVEFKANFLKKLRQQRRQQSSRFNFQCPTKCGRRFTSKTKLVRHMVTAHPPVTEAEKFIICEICGKSISSKANNLRNHILRVHEGVINHTCPHCGKGFYSKYPLRVHILRMHEKERKIGPNRQKNFHCDECPKTFLFESTLMHHKRRDHLGIKNFECEICPYKCYTGSDFRKHVKTHEEKETPRCEKCGQVFVNQGALTNHRRRLQIDCQELQGHKIGEVIILNTGVTGTEETGLQKLDQL